MSKLGLYNSLWAPIVLYLGADVMSIFIMMQFMDSIPYSNDEAAMLEGASYFYIFRKLIVPLLEMTSYSYNYNNSWSWYL